MADKKIIEVSFLLPTCLHLHRDVEFTLREENESVATIRQEELFENEDSRYGRSSGVEVVNDIQGAFRFTRIILEIEDLEPDLPEENIAKAHEQRILSIANTFIDAYRFATGREKIRNIPSLESVHHLRIMRVGESGERAGVLSISFGGGSLTTFLPPRSDEDNLHIQSLLNQGVLLEDQLMMNARRQNHLGHPEVALVMAVTALEVTLPTGSEAPFWKRLLPCGSSTQRKAEKQLRAANVSPEIIAQIVGGIRDRNRIAHVGVRLGYKKVKKYLYNIQEGIDKLRK